MKNCTRGKDFLYTVNRCGINESFSGDNFIELSYEGAAMEAYCQLKKEEGIEIKTHYGEENKYSAKHLIKIYTIPVASSNYNTTVEYKSWVNEDIRTFMRTIREFDYGWDFEDQICQDLKVINFKNYVREDIAFDLYLKLIPAFLQKTRELEIEEPKGYYTTSYVKKIGNTKILTDIF